MDKKRLEEDLVALVFSLFFFAFMYFFISPNLTGFVIYEPSYNYNASEVNLTNGLSIKAIENTTTITTITNYEFSLTSASADDKDVLSEVIALDGLNEEIKKDKIFDITFNGSLENGDIITFKADEVNDFTSIYLCAESTACSSPGYGEINISSVGIYSLTISSLSAANNSFNFDPTEKVKINHVNATKTITTINNTTSYYYPTNPIEIVTEDIEPANLSSFDLFMRNDSLNNQNVSYQYSIDSGSNWIIMPEDNNLTGINSTKIKIKAIMQSDGSGTPYIYSLSVNYTELISNYTGNSTNSTENQTNTTNSSQNTTESNSTNSSQGSGGASGSTSSSGQTATQSTGISSRERAARTAASAPSAPASSPSPAPSAPTQTASQPITGRATAPTGQAIKIEDKTTKENSIVVKVIIGSLILLILITIILTVYEYRKRKALKGLNKK